VNSFFSLCATVSLKTKARGSKILVDITYIDLIRLQYFGQPYLPHCYEASNAPVKKPKPSKKRKKKDSNEPQK